MLQKLLLNFQKQKRGILPTRIAPADYLLFQDCFIIFPIDLLVRSINLKNYFVKK